MKTKNLLDESILSDLFEENQWFRYIAYGAGAVVGIWILGKAAKLLTNAATNFKGLHNALKS